MSLNNYFNVKTFGFIAYNSKSPAVCNGWTFAWWCYMTKSVVSSASVSSNTLRPCRPSMVSSMMKLI